MGDVYGRKGSSMREISPAKLATELGIARQSLMQAIQEGRVTAFRKSGNRHILDADKAAAQFRATAGGPKGGKRVPADHSDDGSDEAKPKLAQIRVAREMKKLQLDTLKFEKERGEVINKAEAEKRIFEIAQELRQNLQNIPSRIVDDILACQTRNEAFLLVENAISEVLSDFSKNLKRGL